MKEVVIDSPLGRLKLTAGPKALLKVSFTNKSITDKSNAVKNDILDQTVRQLEEYFAGERTTFDLPLSPAGTQFQQKVWRILRDIPFGQTTTYGNISEKLGDSNAVRAVGTANGQNPIPIIIPCHRVLGSGQKMTGYSGGIDRKRWLLKHEGALLL